MAFIFPEMLNVGCYSHTLDKILALCCQKKVLLVQPSSAASERVFSILSASFNEQQERAQSDYLQASLMLQYNKRLSKSKHIKASFTLPKNFGTARMKKVRVPKKLVRHG